MTIEHNAIEVSNELGNLAKAVPAVLTRGLMAGGLLLEANIKARTSGRPGPRAVTGDYRRSWNTRNVGSILKPRVSVGTNKPQANRLEFGFTGVDALGRRYDQPPYAHAGPAAAQSEAAVLGVVVSTVNKALGAA